VGRADDIRLLLTELVATRFATIVGPRGVGTTTVAIAVAHDLSEAVGTTSGLPLTRHRAQRDAQQS
jgi:predicted ATPase